jgi:hypothetical protein
MPHAHLVILHAHPLQEELDVAHYQMLSVVAMEFTAAQVDTPVM